MRKFVFLFAILTSFGAVNFAYGFQQQQPAKANTADTPKVKKQAEKNNPVQTPVPARQKNKKEVQDADTDLSLPISWKPSWML
jgi:heme-binding NEAT domain protein